MAYYREISQEYAKQAINTAFLLNGGAAVAILSQAASLKELGMTAPVANGVFIWACGTALAAVTWVMGFLSTRYVDKSEKEPALEQDHLRTSDKFMYGGLISVCLSVLIFIIGCIVISNAFR